jgi:hypothetical protein
VMVGSVRRGCETVGALDLLTVRRQSLPDHLGS